MSIRTLKACIKKHGKAKTAVALGLKETKAISNWVARNEIPEFHKDNVKKLSKLKIVIARFNIDPERA